MGQRRARVNSVAKIHNMLHRGNWSAALKRVLGVEKTDGGIERFGETLTPTVNLWERPEWAWLRQENLWAFRELVGAVVGELSAVAALNPIDSGQIVVVERVTGSNAVVGGSLFAGLSSAAVLQATLTTGGGALARDTRFQRNPLSPLGVLVAPLILTGSDPAQLDPNEHEQVANATVEQLPFLMGPWVLKPATGFFVQGAGANQAVTVSLAGYSRIAFPGELD